MPYRNIPVNLENTVYQAAVTRARQESKSIGQVVGEFLNQYAEGVKSGQATTYTVKRGDTLGKIAKTVYDDVYKYPVIQKANNITDPGRIWIGQVLIIPPLSGSTSTKSTTSSQKNTTSSQKTTQKQTTSTKPTRTTTGRTLVKPTVRFARSPNFNSRRSPNDITGITIHATANSTLEGVISWFSQRTSQVSAHYTIGKDGQIAQHVLDKDRAWHAGRSAWKGRASCNDYCLGIELVNLNNGTDPYPAAQHQANVNLCAYLCAKYNIRTADIMAHYDIALPLGRKTDPRGYDMDRLRRDVATRLGRT